MAEERAPPLPPELRVADVLRPWEEREVEALIARLAGTRWYRELEEEYGDLSRLARYALEKYLSPGLADYIGVLIDATRESSVRESRVGRRFMEELSRRGLSETVVDWFVETYLGVRRYAGLAAPLEAIPVLSMVPAPPEGLPSTAGPYRPGHYYADGEAAETLVVAASQTINGPLFFTRKNHSWEVRFDGVGYGAVVVWVLWELLFCILYRFWVPVVVWRGRVPGVARLRMSIDYTYVTGYAVQPIAVAEKGAVTATLRKIV